MRLFIICKTQTALGVYYFVNFEKSISSFTKDKINVSSIVLGQKFTKNGESAVVIKRSVIGTKCALNANCKISVRKMQYFD